MAKNNTVNIDLIAELKEDKVYLSAMPLFDFLLIAIFLVVLSSKFIVSSGTAIALNADETVLPVSINSEMKGVLTDSELTVLHIQSENMILFDGAIYNMESFANYLKDRDDLSKQVLLLKLNKDCNIQIFLNITEICQSAGFKAVQIASQKAN
ncbi:MAG: biopolymer transporter ExbD [Opitutales bacterium]